MRNFSLVISYSQVMNVFEFYKYYFYTFPFSFAFTLCKRFFHLYFQIYVLYLASIFRLLFCFFVLQCSFSIRIIIVIFFTFDSEHDDFFLYYKINYISSSSYTAEYVSISQADLRVQRKQFYSQNIHTVPGHILSLP